MINTKVDVLEERMKNLIKSNEEDHLEILKQIACIRLKLDEAFVTKDEFDPVRKIVYGLVTIAMSAFAYAIIRVIGQHPVL